MTSRLSARHAVLAIVFAVAPVAAHAQDTVPSFDPATITVTAADGTAGDYQINDLGVYLSSTPAYDDVPAATDFSLSFVVLSPIDAKLLEWAAQAGVEAEANRDLVIVASVPDAAGAMRELTYEIGGAHITSISTSHSTYAAPSVSLSVSADTLVIDGVTMK